jgi:hypothetical protein
VGSLRVVKVKADYNLYGPKLSYVNHFSETYNIDNAVISYDSCKHPRNVCMYTPILHKR